MQEVGLVHELDDLAAPAIGEPLERCGTVGRLGVGDGRPWSDAGGGAESRVEQDEESDDVVVIRGDECMDRVVHRHCESLEPREDQYSVTELVSLGECVADRVDGQPDGQGTCGRSLDRPRRPFLCSRARSDEDEEHEQHHDPPPAYHTSLEADGAQEES